MTSGSYDYLGSPEFREQRQRERICSAFMQALSARGYEQTTVARVAELSGCSTETFHRYYEDLDELFCDACSHTLQESRSATVTAWLTVHGWSERLRRSCEALLRHVDDHHDATRAVLVASLAGGPEVSRHVREAVAFHERALVMAFQLHPEGFATSRLTPRALTGGMREVIYRRMCEGCERDVSELAGDLHEWIECHRSPAAARLPLMQHPSQPQQELGVAAGDDSGHGARLLTATPSLVDADEHARVHHTILQLMSQQGRETLDDATVARFAGISAARFEADYGGLGQCATQIVDGYLTGMDAALATGAAKSRSWPESVRLAVVECMRHLDRNRRLTRLVLLRLPLVPHVAQTRHAALPQHIVACALEQAPPPRYGKDLIPDALVGAVSELLTWVVAGGMFARLPALANHIAFFLLAPYIDGEQAAETVIASADAEWLG
jgi:AcrR family transcriptional regulator